ncbi:hypothetical protein [Stenotrophomonas sp. PD6]|uniref:hypothetical protein n=1 Tax=Stenotrophomonas sp. PD6 TaxID=3368612 RepID=UPI003BA3DF50
MSFGTLPLSSAVEVATDSATFDTMRFIQGEGGEVVKYATSIVVVGLSLLPLASAAAQDRASLVTEKQLWAFSERIALALPGDGSDVSKLVSASAASTTSASGSTEYRAASSEIGPSLSASNSVVVMGKAGRAYAVSFDLKGSCVPFKSLRTKYPSLIVLDQPRDDNEHARYSFGAHVGDSIIAYSFPAKKIGCMNHVDITPAAPLKARK